ncbi:MAG: TonB-dependent receptor [Tannerella sp.]|nr:TonB-dependent receptor [Tannerella sp.]
MKITTFFLFVLVIHLSAENVHSQNASLSLHLKNVTMENAINEIEKKTAYKFVFTDKVVDTSRTLDIRVSKGGISDILNQLTLNTDLEYRIVDKQIVLSKKNKDVTQEATRKITGIVADENGEPVIEANVVEKGTTNGITTDIDGNFSLTIPNNAILQVSYIGYITREIQVSSQSYYSIVLKEDLKALEEVVVVGYGTQRKGYLTGSVSDIKSEKLTIAPIANASQALAGQLPGLIAKNVGGQPGSDAAQLSIRGFGNALVIVDGVESSFTNLDPSQIESISILKDGAASIYGARAGNGVILVTSKRGIDSKPTITVNSSLSMQGVTRMLKPASSGQWAEMDREQHLQAGLPEETAPWTEADIEKFYAGNDPAFVNSDWFDFIFRPFAPMQNHNLSIRGGSDKIKYYGLLGYTDQETMIKRNGGSFQRYNIQSNIDAKVTQYMTLSIDLSLVYEDHYFAKRGMSTGGYFWNDVYGSKPWYPTTLPDPTKISYCGLSDIGSAYAMSNIELTGYNQTKNRNIRGGISLEYDFSRFVKGLKAKAYINYRDDETLFKGFWRPYDFYTYNPNTQEYTRQTPYKTAAELDESFSRGTVFTQQYSLSYENLFNEKHRLSALVLYESINYLNNNFSARRDKFISPSIEQLSAGSSIGQSNSGGASEMGRMSYVGRLNYSYKDRYLIETILRADASSRFDAGYRWGYFPSVSVGWIMSEEGFMNKMSFLDNLKIRASYGQSGNDAVANFAYLAGYAIEPYSSYILGDTPQKLLYPTGLANPLLSWEKMTIYNAGFDFSIAQRKLYGTAEGFYRDRTGIPASRLTSLPSSFGATLPVENLNEISDRGFELSLGTVQKVGELTMDVSANISWSRSRWEHFEEPEYEDPDQRRIYKLTGKWTDALFGYKSDKLFTSQDQINSLGYEYVDLPGGNATLRPGDVRLLNTNGDDRLDWRDQVEIGSGTTPHWMYGFNVMMKYRNFDLNALFQGAFGYTTSIYMGTFKTDKLYKLRWTEKNNDANAVVPRLGGAAYTSDYFYKMTSYIRLKNLSIGYELPDEWLSKVGITQLRLYLAGTNLFTLSNLNKYGIDPEQPQMYGYYPQQRTYSVGLNLSF